MAAPKKRLAREVDYFTAVVMMNDFVDRVLPSLKPAEAKLLLVIWRKTIGWNKLSEEIGTKELSNRARLDRDTVKDTIRSACQKGGVVIEQEKENGVLSRRRYTWPINERVAATLDKTYKGSGVGGKLPPTHRGQNTPEGEGQNPPTQSYRSQLHPSNVRYHPIACRFQRYNPSTKKWEWIEGGREV
jgi:hypothetical protein